MKMKKLLPLLLAVLMLATACSQAPANSPAPSASNPTATQAPAPTNETPAGPAVGGDITIGIISTPVTLSPWITNDVSTSMIMNIALPSLLTFNENAEKVPYILESFEPNADATEFTVKLHEGLTWHDTGEPVTAADLVFTAEYMPSHDLSYYSGMFANVTAVEQVDEYTVKYTLAETQVNFVNQWGIYVPIMPKHIFENVEEPNSFEYDGTGYGPYKLVDYRSGEYYSFERVENWPLANDGEGAYLNSITFRVYTDQNALALALKTGEIQACDRIPLQAQQQLTSEPEKFDLLSVPSMGYGWVGISRRNEFLQDPAVRTAFAMTVDREALVNIALQGQANVMQCPVSPIYGDTFAQIKQPEFDVAGARQVLADAGYVEKDGMFYSKDGATPLSLVFTYRSTTAGGDEMVSIFTANAKAAGIELKPEVIDNAGFGSKIMTDHNFDLVLVEWGSVDDVDYGYLRTIYGPDNALNMMEYQNDAMQANLNATVQEVSREGRIALVNEFQQMFVEELPTVNLFARSNYYGYNVNYQGWNLCPGLNGVVDCKNISSVYFVG